MEKCTSGYPEACTCKNFRFFKEVHDDDDDDDVETIIETSAKLMQQSWLSFWITKIMGSGCGSVGRVVAFNISDSRFASSRQQILFSVNCIEKSQTKK